MRAGAPCANTHAMSPNVNEEDSMISTSTFFIEAACVAGISPLDTDAEVRRARARRAPLQRDAPAAVEEAEERFLEELLGTFTDRWEW